MNGDQHSPPPAESMPGFARPLDGLDPDGPLDDLEPLAEIVGEARVVALGENAHFVSEFTHVRQRLSRFLAEHCGFRVFAYEFSFTAAPAVDRWVHGAGAVEDLAAISPAAAGWGGGGLLGFLRRHNQHSGQPVRLVGVDVPEAGGTLLPALEPLRDYLADVDPDGLPRVDAAIDLAARIAAGSAPAAVPAWRELGACGRDTLTAALARLRLRMRALEPTYVERSSQQRFDTVLRGLEAAAHADYMLAATDGLLASGGGLAADASVRDRFMAETVRWHLDHADPDERIVLVAHNNHIQKTPVAFAADEEPTALPMGQHLHRELGTDYIAIALTHTSDHVPEMTLDDSSPVGFTIQNAPLDAPQPGSLEAAAIAAGTTTGLIDLTTTGSSKGLDRLRSQSGYVHTPVRDAFNAALIVPTATLDPTVNL